MGALAPLGEQPAHGRLLSGDAGVSLEVDGAWRSQEHQQAQGFIKNKVRGLLWCAMAKIPHPNAGGPGWISGQGLNPHAATENVFASTKDSTCHN